MYFNLAKATLIVALTGSVAAWSMPWSNVNVARRDGYDDFAILPIPVYKGNDKSYNEELAKYGKELEAGLKKTKGYIANIKESKNEQPKKHSTRDDDKKVDDKDTNDAKKDEQVKKHNDEVKKFEENIKDQKEKYLEDFKSDKKDVKEDIKKSDTKAPSVDDIKKAEEEVKKQQTEAIKNNKAAAKEATNKNRGKN